MKTIMAFIRSYFFLNVFAEEITTTIEQPPTNTKTDENPEDKTGGNNDEKPVPKPSGELNYEDLIKRARQEEKDKLYGQITKLKDEVSSLKKDKNDLLTVVAEREDTIKQLEGDLVALGETKGKLEKDLKDGTATNKTVSNLTLKISQLEAELEKANAEHEKELNTIKITQHKEKLIAQANGEIIPELVVGETEEEIAESVERAKARYQEITQSAKRSIKMPYANPNAGLLSDKTELSEADIMNMTPQQWQEHRKKIGLK